MAEPTALNIAVLEGVAQSGEKLYKPFADLRANLEQVKALIGYQSELQDAIKSLESSVRAAQSDADKAINAANEAKAKADADLEASKSRLQAGLAGADASMAAAQANHDAKITALNDDLTAALARYNSARDRIAELLAAAEKEAADAITAARVETKLYLDKRDQAKSDYDKFVASLGG